MHIVAPRSAFAILGELAIAQRELAQRAERVVEPAFQQRLTQAEVDLRATLDQLDLAQTAKRQAAAARSHEGDRLIGFVRDFHQNLRRSAKRDPATRFWRETFSLKQPLPSKNRLNALWFEQARQIAEAGQVALTQLAAAAADVPVALPSSPAPSQVATVLAVAQTAQQRYLAACVTLKQAEAAARSARGQGQRLLAALRRRLAGQFHELPPETRRREMMKFGVRYANAAPSSAAEEPSVPLTTAPTSLVEIPPLPVDEPPTATDRPDQPPARAADQPTSVAVKEEKISREGAKARRKTLESCASPCSLRPKVKWRGRLAAFHQRRSR